MKYEFKLRTVAHNSASISRITKEHAEFLAATTKSDFDDILKKARCAGLDGTTVNIIRGMSLIVIH